MDKESLEKLNRRFDNIMQRIAALEASLRIHRTNPDSCPVSNYNTQRLLAEELLSKGIVNHKFVRAPPEYYDQSLEFRRDILQAASTNHLCKSIIMENTRCEGLLPGKTLTDPGNGKYYLVIVQYTAKLNAEKLKVLVKGLTEGALSKKQINMRLVAEEISQNLSGFGHNAVSPIGIKTRLPIIFSHKIAELQPDFFWLGAGEVDLKVGMKAADFIEVYNPLVYDCTMD